jgi:hypothetical protein
VPKISQFPDAGTAQNTDRIPIVRNGGDYTVTGYNLAALASYGQSYAGTFTGTGAQTSFTLPATPGSLANLYIAIDGITKVPGTDFSYTSPVTLTFAVAPSNGAVILYQYRAAVPIGIAGAGGVNNQIQYNNSGFLNGFTVNGDGTLVAITGALTVTKTNGTAFAASATTNTTLTGNINYTQGSTGSVARTVTNKFQETPSVADFGAVGAGADESSAAIAMINALNYLYIPPNFTLVAKNLPLNNSTEVKCDGTMKLPSGCSDFDRLMYADSKSNIIIDVREIDGNYTGQSGNIGTHLVYLTNCTSPSVNVGYSHDHYIASGASMPSIDGYRNSSTGPLWLYQCDKATFNLGLLSGWGREGVYLQNCTNGVVTVGHCQGSATRNTEYSGVQVSGVGNELLRASVDFAGASGVGFDTQNGIISNILSTRTRENHGVNFGHPSYPASLSVASNIVVDSAFLDGIKVSASTTDLTIDNFSVRNAGRYGVSVSDSSVRGKITSGVVQYCGQANLQVSVTEVQSSNVRSSDLDTVSVTVTMSSGTFVDGETVTAPGGKSATARKAIRNLTNTSEILFLDSVTGTFVVTDVITGGTSGAVGTASAVNTPVQYLEQSGGLYADSTRYFAGSGGNQIRFSDGSAIMFINVTVSGTANTLVTSTTSFSSNVVWTSAPTVSASIQSAVSTDGFVIAMMRAAATTTQLTIKLKTDQTQTYGIGVIAVGRWK